MRSPTVTPPLLRHVPIAHFDEQVRWALDWKGCRTCGAPSVSTVCRGRSAEVPACVGTEARA